MTQKIALITGANKGIGLETARQLAEAGMRVIVAGRRLGAAQAVAATLVQAGLAAEAIALDVTDPASIAAAVETVGARHGRLDVLVNNAGVMRDAFDKKPSEQSIAVWRATFDTNVFGLVAVTNAFLPLLALSENIDIKYDIALGNFALIAMAIIRWPPLFNQTSKNPKYEINEISGNCWSAKYQPVGPCHRL